jgi:isopentenyl diphosphate isomerase/L-lactate dehydrogenase-like FMN-dependent dehydrogenase
MNTVSTETEMELEPENLGMEKFIPSIRGQLKKHIVHIPEIITKHVTGIKINEKLIKSIIFTTDIAIIRNMNADAIIAVYPFTPDPVITQALMMAADVPVFCGVGGGTTQGARVVNLAKHAEYQGAMGVVVNSPTKNEVIKEISQSIDIPIILTVVSEKTDIQERLDAGTAIINVSGARNTPDIIRKIRQEYGDSIPIIATGGPNDTSIMQTIEAGANAVTYTPPTNGEIFSELMRKYRDAEM